MNLKEKRDRLDWQENQSYPWRCSPMTMVVGLAITLVLVWVVGHLVGG